MSLARLVGLVLGGACGLLALISVALFIGVGSGIGVAEPDPATLERPLPSLDGNDSFSRREETAYAMVAQRPLFNEDRRPDPNAGAVDEPEDGAEDGDAVVEEPPPPLEVEVKGIIIAPELRLAIVTDPKSKSTLRLREGMPLEGELAAWTLAQIEPRKLVFDGQGAETAEVELVVNTKALASAPPVKNRTPAAGENQPVDDSQAAADGEQLDPEARAEEIRRRVAERRAQLREEAERRRAQRENDEEQ